MSDRQGAIMQTAIDEEPTTAEEPVWPRHRWSLLATAAAVLTVVGIAIGILAADGDGAPEFTAESALAIVDDYFERHNAGDIDATFALFTDDAIFSDTYGVYSEAQIEASDPDDRDRANWERRLAWDMAQGEKLIEPECVVTDDLPGAAVTIWCRYGTLDAVGLAIGASMIPSTAMITIGPGGISELREFYGSPDFADTGIPFSAWMERTHLDDAEAAGCCAGDTVEESIARGELRARYAAEWNAHLAGDD